MINLPPIDPTAAGHVFQGVAGATQDPTLLLGTFLIVVARFAGFFIVAPFFGSMNVPMTVRVAFVAVLSIVLTPFVQEYATPALVEAGGKIGIPFFLLLINQALVGVMFGFIGAFVFYAIESAGRIIDTQRGSNITDIIAPQTGDRTSPTGQWLNMVALIILVITGGHLLMLDAFIDTFRIFPPTASLDWITAHGAKFHAMEKPSSAISMFAYLSGHSLLATLQVAAPAMISLMLADVLLGIINRGAPQVNVFALSQVVKGPIGIGAVLIALVPIMSFINDQLISSIFDSSVGIPRLAELMAGG